jgi:hypothetical protein
MHLHVLLAKSVESTLLETSSCCEERVGYIPEDIRLKVSVSTILDVVTFDQYTSNLYFITKIQQDYYTGGVRCQNL